MADVTAASDSAFATIRTALADESGSKLASIFTSDAAIIMPSGQSVEGRLTIRATATLMLTAFGSGKLTVNRQHISIVDDTPYETGSYSFERPLDGDGKVQRYAGRYTLIWQREDGVWKIHRAIGIR